MSNVNDRIDELLKEMGVDPKTSQVPIKVGNKRNVVVGSGGWLGQRFPVTLYAPSWLWLLREENAHHILDFLEEHKDQLSWGADR